MDSSSKTAAALDCLLLFVIYYGMNLCHITNKVMPPRPQCPCAYPSRPLAACLGLITCIPLLDVWHPCLFPPVVEVLAPCLSSQAQECSLLISCPVRHHLDSFEPVPRLLLLLLLIPCKLLPIAQQIVLGHLPFSLYLLLYPAPLFVPSRQSGHLTSTQKQRGHASLPQSSHDSLLISPVPVYLLRPARAWRTARTAPSLSCHRYSCLPPATMCHSPTGTGPVSTSRFPFPVS